MKRKINWKDKDQVKAYWKAYYQRPEVKAYHKAYMKAYDKAREKSMVKIPGGKCYADGFSKIIQKQVPELTFNVMKKMLKEK